MPAWGDPGLSDPLVGPTHYKREAFPRMLAVPSSWEWARGQPAVASSGHKGPWRCPAQHVETTTEALPFPLEGSL